MREGIDELIVQRVKYLMKTERVLDDPILVLAKQLKVLTWVVAATAVTQVTLRLF